MQKDVLDYLKYLKEKDPYLYDNYSNLSKIIQKILTNKEIINILNELENKNTTGSNIYEEKDILNCVYSFFHKISPNLSNKFYKNIENGNIIYDEKIEKSQIIEIRNEETLELEKYIIKIKKTNKIEDFVEIVHEFTHYLINKINKNKSINKSTINIYDETIAIYSEILFFNFIKNKIPYEEATKFIYKRIFNSIIQGYDLYMSYKAINLIVEGKTYDEVTEEINDNIFFENFKIKIKNKEIFPYEHFLGTLTALKLYNNNINIMDLINLIQNNKTDEIDQILMLKIDVDETIKLIININNELKEKKEKQIK